MLYFWLLLLAHGLADFLFQTDAISSAKCKNQWHGYAYHGLGVLLCTLAAINFFGWVNALLAAFLITAVHLSLDWLKNMGRSVHSRIVRRTLRPGVPGFILDQALHIVTLLWVWYIFEIPADAAITKFYSDALAPMAQFPWVLENVVPVLAVYVLVALGGAVLVRMSLDQLFPDGKLRGETPAGKYIGILERALIITLAATGNISAIGFVFTAKSIARFNEIAENRQFAEYYLIGTLISFFLALAAGLALAKLI